MHALHQLCHLAYGPLSKRVLDARKAGTGIVEEEGLLPAIQLSGGDFDAEGYPSQPVADPNEHTAGQRVYAPAELIHSFGVSPNSVLYLAKGSLHRACLPTFESPLPLLTGSSFIHLEVKAPELLLRDFLFLQLRSPTTWRQLERRQEGAFIKNINRGALADLKVDVPPLARQEAVVAYARMQRHAATLRDRLTAIDQLRLSALLNPEP